ncbi:MAG: DUF4397 domain-containing protein [Gemmatimonadota bacterium]|nr:DUF4397 domain-containing protein [Gemmatimonadota bacterium]
MSRRSTVLVALSALALGSCRRDPASPETGELAHLRLLAGAASAARVDVRVDGEMKLTGLPFGQLSAAIDLAPGAHSLVVVPAGSIIDVIGRTFLLGPGKITTVVAVDSAGGINPVVLSDTGAVAIAGRSKLRVVHLAEQAPPIDVWRTQPDYPALIRVMFPFPYRAESPYLRSTPGNWSVVVSHAGATDTLAMTGPIAIGDGHVLSVLLLDKPGGGIQTVVTEP